jgi:hypothetical protein
MAGLFDPLNPLAGLENVPGVGTLPGAESYITSGQVQGGAQGLMQGINNNYNPLLTLGLTGLGAVTGGQKSASDLAGIAKTRQDMVKSGLDITKTGIDIQQKGFDFKNNQTARNALMLKISQMSPEDQLLALSNPDEFAKSLISNAQPTTSVKEYEYAKRQGYPGSYTDYVQNVEKSRAANMTATLTNEKDKLMFKADLENYNLIAGDANKARQVANRTQSINQILGELEGGGVVKVQGDLQAFLGLNTEKANKAQVIAAMQNIGATLVRTVGSGSTSDMEFNAYRTAFPSMATTKEGRILMGKVADANAKRTSKLAAWMKKEIQEKGSYRDDELYEYDKSLGDAMSADLKKKLDQYIPEENKSTYDFSEIDNELNIGGSND